MRRTILASLIAGLLLSACGAAAGTGASSTPKASDAFAFSRCMRAHGVTNFPDPSTTSGGGIRLKVGPGTGVDPSSPTFRAAQQACAHFLPGLATAGHPTAQQQAQALAFADCMRRHGVPGFPDPTRTPPSPGGASSGRPSAVLGVDGLFFVLGPGVAPNSPAFQHAQSACGRP
jgi:hypothetical protein